jgi:uncharacterized protein YkwD
MTACGARPGKGAVAVLTVAALTACGAGDAAPADPATPSPTGAAYYAARVVEKTNEARTAEGLRALATSECAAQQARSRAEALRGRALEHAPLKPVREACEPPSGLTAENLSRSAASPADVVQAWLESPGHRNNLLSAEVTEIGVACVVDAGTAQEHMLCSQIFLG